MHNSSNNIKSPCSRNCCLNQQNICLGCFRHIDEIIAWQSYSKQNKEQIMLACQQRCKEIVALKSLN